MDTIDDVFPEDPFFNDDYPVDHRSCRLLGPTALIVQALMGVLVISSLVFKRHREKPKRPWRIWAFDVSKQISGQAFVHGVNILISDLVAHRALSNPCVLYFLNILIDTTLGVALIYLIHHLLVFLFTHKLHLKGFVSGIYSETPYDPPSIWYWLRQAAVYWLALTSMKLSVISLFMVWPGIFKVGQWLLTWTGSGDELQVIFAMGLFPITMNILQFWLIDSIVKASAKQIDTTQSERPPRTPAGDNEPLINASDSNSDDEDGAEIVSCRYDVENPAPNSASVSYRSQSRKASAEELKAHSTKVNTVHAEDNDAIHAYPPHPPDFYIYGQPSSPSVYALTTKKRPPAAPQQTSSASTHVIAIAETSLAVQKLPLHKQGYPIDTGFTEMKLIPVSHQHRTT